MHFLKLYDNNTPFTDSANKSELTLSKNSVLLEQLWLYTISQQLNNTVAGLLSIAEA
jgi:hypothetical protein